MKFSACADCFCCLGAAGNFWLWVKVMNAAAGNQRSIPTKHTRETMVVAEFSTLREEIRENIQPIPLIDAARRFDTG